MNSILILVIAFLAYVIAYRTYGRYLGRKLFKISSKRVMPSQKYKDGIDYVPTNKMVIFGHHFTTIAGVGPIVGPAIGVVWGWLPALLWIIFGSIFMGAFHDFGTMVISGRNDGKTIGEITGNVIPGTRVAFQLIIQLLLLIVLSIFALIVSTLFILHPESVIPVWLQVPIALWLGVMMKKGKNIILYTIIAVILMYLSIFLGNMYPLDLSKLGFYQKIAHTPEQLNNYVTITWCLISYIYVSIASILPVNVLLQSRDFINSMQLFVAMLLIVGGIVIVNPEISAPALSEFASSENTDIPSIAPLLFIIIACGAISGFHSVASTGTSIKQVKSEKDTLFIGYGSMLTEGFLAVLVIICIAAGLGLGVDTNNGSLYGREAFNHYYSSFSIASSGIEGKIESFVIGTANILERINIPVSFSTSMIALFIISFANTTIDSATRIQRIALQELIGNTKVGKTKLFNNRYFTTIVVVILALCLSLLKPGGAGAMILWPLFGSLNQLMAALGLTVVTVYLYNKKRNYLLAAIPMVFVFIMTIWSLIKYNIIFIKKQEVLLVVLSAIVGILTLWVLFGAIKAMIKHISR